jgi:hypothetical protein
MALVMLVLAASIHIRQAAAQVPQSQVQPTPKPALTLRWLSKVTLDKAITVGGSVNGDITGTIYLLRSTTRNLTVTLTAEGCLLDEWGILVATVPSTVTIPAGSDRVTFRIRTFSSPNTLNPITCTVGAHYAEETIAADFTVEPLRITSFTIVPAAGIGPFTATATIVLNARPAVNKTVTLTSSNPAVQFGTIGNAQPNADVTFTSTRSQRIVQVIAGTVTQSTGATITARLGAQTQTHQLTVRTAF